MQKPRSEQEIISDLDGELVNFLIQVRDSWHVLKPMCQNDYDRSFFSFARQNLNVVSDPLEAARYFFSWNRQAFRNLPHTSSWDPLKSATFKSALDTLPQAAKRLRGVEIRRMHFRSALLLYGDDPETFAYLDPPYLFPERPGSVRQRYRASGVYRIDMGEPERHLELLRLVKTLRGKVMISGYPSRLYDRELAGWRTKRKAVLSMQAIQNFRRERMEVIWMNY